MVKGDDAVNLGTGDVQGLRHHPDGGLGYVAERLLQGVQDRQHRAVPIAVLRNDVNGTICAPDFVIGQLMCSSSNWMSPETGQFVTVDQQERSDGAIGKTD
jgi:hypothetical protein